MQDDVTISRFYPTRSSELPVIHGNRIHLFKRIAGLEPELDEVNDFEMNTTQFLTAAILYQTNIFHTIHFIDILVGNSALLVFGTFLAVQILVAIPLLILFLFMSSYSKKGFLRFWESVPMFAGLGYSMLMCRLTYAVFQVYFTSVSFLLVVDFLHTGNIDQVLKDCAQVNEYICHPMYPKENMTIRCPTAVKHRLSNESVYIATQYHYRFQVIEYVRHQITRPKLHTTQLLISLFIWCTVFMVSLFGVQRIAKITLRIQMCFNLFSAFAVIYGMVLSDDPVKPRAVGSNLSKIDFWVEMLIHSTNMVVLTDMIFMGTLKPKSLSPIQAGLLVGALKIVFFVLVMFFTQRCSQLILGHYKFNDSACLIIFGHDVLFAFVPDILYRVRFGSANMLVWYLSMFFSNTNTLIYTVIGIVSGLTEKFAKLYKYRVFVYMGVCILGFLGTLYFCTNLSVNTIYTYRQYGDVYFTTMCFFTLNLALMFVYSTKRIVEDYTFTYGSPPNRYWVAAWQTSPIVALFSFIFMLYQFKNIADETFASTGTMVWSYLHCTLIIIPILSHFLAKCFKHVKYRTLSTVTKPSDKWGPHNQIKRQTRKFFYPQRDVRYRNHMLTCQHRCIANSLNFFEENRKQAAKLHRLMKEMENEQLEGLI